MADNYNMFDKMNGNIQKKKLEKALEMFRTENPQELKKKLGQIDTKEIMEKINEIDPKQLNQMGISLDEIKSKITEKDLEKLTQILGSDGAAIAQRIRAILK